MDYLRDSHRALLSRLLPSAMGTLLSETITSLVDSIVLAYYLGADMMATISVSMPIYLAVNTIAMLIASGGATVFAQSLGRGDEEEAQRCFSCSALLMLLCGALMTLVGVPFVRQIVLLLGGDGVFEATVAYSRIQFLFMVPLLLYQLLVVFVRFDGGTTRTVVSTVVCSVVNLLLDVLLVGHLGAGATGAAMATCLAYTAAMLVNAGHFISGRRNLVFRRGSLTMPRVQRILRTGVPLSLSQLGMAVETALFNNFAGAYGGVMYQNVYGVIVQISGIIWAVYEGIAQACQPIMATCFGAGNRARLDRTLRIGMRLETGLMAVVTAVCLIAPGLVAELFSMNEPTQRSIAVTAVRIYSLSLLFTSQNTMYVYYYQAQKREKLATLIVLLSGTVLPILFLYLLSAFIGVNGIWWSYLCAQGLTLAFCAAYHLRQRKRGAYEAE